MVESAIHRFDVTGWALRLLHLDEQYTNYVPMLQLIMEERDKSEEAVSKLYEHVESLLVASRSGQPVTDVDRYMFFCKMNLFWSETSWQNEQCRRVLTALTYTSKGISRFSQARQSEGYWAGFGWFDSETCCFRNSLQCNLIHITLYATKIGLCGTCLKI